MADSQHRQDTTAEGVWALDESGRYIDRSTGEPLAQSSTEDTIRLEGPSTNAIAEYISQLPPTQKKMCGDLRGQGWQDAGIHNVLTLLENSRKQDCARLRMKGTSEEEIAQLDRLCDQGITDYSSLVRPLATPADEDYQAQLYLLDEVTRQRRVIFGKK